MTEGHKHRMVHVYDDSRLLRLLRKPLIHNTSLRKVDASPYPYGPCYHHGYSVTGRNDCYYLSGLSLLHRWFGLTFVVVKRDG